MPRHLAPLAWVAAVASAAAASASASASPGGDAEDGACGVQRLAELTGEDFRRDYREARPVIVQTGVEDLGLGGPEDAERIFGKLDVTAGESFTRRSVGSQPMLLAAFLQKNRDAGWQEGLDYVLDVAIMQSPSALPSMSALLTWFEGSVQPADSQRVFAHDTEDAADEHASARQQLELVFRAPEFLRGEDYRNGPMEAWRYLLVGHDGAGVPAHAHGEGYNLLIYGEKIWEIRPPSGSKTFKCRQRAGEVVYLPQDWEHTVQSVGPTLGVAVQRRVLPFTWRHWLSLASCVILGAHSLSSRWQQK